jgi:hypothetical protein
MPTLNVFRQDAFGIVEMTESINRSTYVPGRIGQLGLFTKKFISTTSVMLERKGASIALLPSKPRGTRPTVHKPTKRSARTFTCPHIPYDDTILADSIQNLRAWGSDTELESVASVVNDTLDEMRQNHELTHEFHRIGAIKGTILDGDGSTTLYDLYSEFGISQTSVDFTLGTSTTDIKLKVETVRRAIEDALGMLTYTGILALCGNTFWDKLVSHADVKNAWTYWQNGQFFRESQRALGGFDYLGVQWENYRGQVSDVPFIGASDCYFVPMGVPNLFIAHYAPADTMDAVNTPGKEVYAMQEIMPFNKGVEIHTQSNPLMLNTRPEVVIKGTTSN